MAETTTTCPACKGTAMIPEDVDGMYCVEPGCGAWVPQPPKDSIEEMTQP